MQQMNVKTLKDYYFRTIPTFEVYDEKYKWMMNQIVKPQTSINVLKISVQMSLFSHIE